MHVDHNMHVIGCNMHVTCTLFRIGIWSSTCLCSVQSGLVLACVRSIWSSTCLCSVVSGLVLVCVQ